MRMQDDREIGTTAMQLWTYPQARKAVSYLRSLVQSLRENWLEMQQSLRTLRRIDARTGRSDRKKMIERDEARREVERTTLRFEETLAELTAADVYCLDPALGLALLPFRQGDELAWFVFDLFSDEGLESWRFQSDPVEARRPLAKRWALWSA
jgi:hypothetical protein